MKKKGFIIWKWLKFLCFSMKVFKLIERCFGKWWWLFRMKKKLFQHWKLWSYKQQRNSEFFFFGERISGIFGFWQFFFCWNWRIKQWIFDIFLVEKNLFKMKNYFHHQQQQQFTKKWKLLHTLVWEFIQKY